MSEKIQIQHFFMLSNRPLVRFHSGIWSDSQRNYSTIKKEILSIEICISKFQDYLYNKKVLLRIDCKLAKEFYKRNFKI